MSDETYAVQHFAEDGMATVFNVMGDILFTINGFQYRALRDVAVRPNTYWVTRDSGKQIEYLKDGRFLSWQALGNDEPDDYTLDQIKDIYQIKTIIRFEG